jgi:NADPH:quinone reductase-like Zn-dependent oxidoreductase
MKTAWYEKQGAARDMLVVANMDDPQPSAGEVRIRIALSGVNPGDVKKRAAGNAELDWSSLTNTGLQNAGLTNKRI